nr:TaqI-like C-terminal specificity domain-containing protein [Halobacterium salinarum]
MNWNLARGGRFEGRDDWYDFGYPKSMDRFEDPKLIGAEIASEATFMLDEIGSWYFKAAYGVQLKQQYQDRTEVFAGLLNSNALDFYLKHYTSLKMGGDIINILQIILKHSQSRGQTKT